MIAFQYNDGGRAEAGFKGFAGDCAVRAIVIASDEDYRVVYAELAHLMRRRGNLTRGKTTPRDGVPMPIIHEYLDSRGWVWTPTMRIGQGCTTHLRADELPAGRVIVRVTKHVCAVIDGVLHDLEDCARDGTRCVYGHWTLPTDQKRVLQARAGF